MKIRPSLRGFESMKSEPLFERTVTILSGGVGGAKLVLGMAARCPPASRLNVIVNTADDAVFHGLHVSPDLDTTLYTLAGISNRETGWGIARETFHALSMLERYGEETWFRLGDRDLAIHILRTKLLREGKTLTEITSFLSQRLGVQTRIIPMTDEKVETLVRTRGRWLPFQEYFVLSGGKGFVEDVRFKGIRKARPTAQAIEALNQADLIIFAPSNPVVSILPIVSLRGLRDALKRARGYRVAVSPFVGKRAFSGPAKELIEALGYEGSSLGLARFYQGLIDLLIIDKRDAAMQKRIASFGMKARITSTLMKTERDKLRLAGEILETVLRLPREPRVLQ
jgi:LPPG:FO 2-phospho-L-lactate transferase